MEEEEIVGGRGKGGGGKLGRGGGGTKRKNKQRKNVLVHTGLFVVSTSYSRQ